MVEEACSAMLDPELFDAEAAPLATASGGAELICPTANRTASPANTKSANKAVENDRISCLLGTENRELRTVFDLHLVLAEIVVAQAFQPLAQFVAGDAVG